MGTVTAKHIGDIYTRWGALDIAAVYAEVAAIHHGVPLTEVLDKPQDERQQLYREASLLMEDHGTVDHTDEGWIFHLATPVVGGNSVSLEALNVKVPSGRVIAHYGCPKAYRTGPPLLRWQIATCAELPIAVIENLSVGDYLFIAEIVGRHANADFELING